ncbi:MAG: DUF2065 domain-containing protein [Desulfobulbaceae bacterium]|uniref:DUF2065 domain-containing protein n=1 Tax=Candidatus Desulfatifera sulfidica TaxID=2841691 RepID=A0A8J6N9W4_9BACT|nr:DUF2065 domain-containing protein [Candidatus Desulfatifera sulfidica]
MKLLVLLVGMVLILEGLPYVVAPEAMREWLKKISTLPNEHVRIIGSVAMGLGFLICWVAQKTSVFGG